MDKAWSQSGLTGGQTPLDATSPRSALAPNSPKKASRALGSP